MSTYNGWTNFETWKVNLEVFDGWEAGAYLSAEEAEEIAYCYYMEGVEKNSLAHGVIRLFLDQVNYEEIAGAHSNEGGYFI